MWPGKATRARDRTRHATARGAWCAASPSSPSRLLPTSPALLPPLLVAVIVSSFHQRRPLFFLSGLPSFSTNHAAAICLPPLRLRHCSPSASVADHPASVTVPSLALLLPFLSLLVVGPVPSLPADGYAVASPHLFYPLLQPPTPLFLIAIVEFDSHLQTLSHGLCYRAPSTTVSISSVKHRWPPPSPSSPLCPLRHHCRPPTPSPSSPVMFTMASLASPLHPRFTIGSCSTLMPDAAVTSTSSFFSTVASPHLLAACCRYQHRHRHHPPCRPW